MRLLLPPPRKENTKREKYWKIVLLKIHTLESMADTQKSGRKQICRNPFRQEAPCLFSSVMLKVGIGYADSEVCEDRGHNLFLPKMRRISARQLNHRNDNRKVCPIRKNKFFFGRTAHFIYLCINNKSCLKRQQIKEVRGIWVVTKS